MRVECLTCERLLHYGIRLASELRPDARCKSTTVTDAHSRQNLRRSLSAIYQGEEPASEQGQGVARMLWEHAKAQCLAQGNSGIFTVNSALNAQAVYLGFGFVPLGPERERGGIRDIPMQLVL